MCIVVTEEDLFKKRAKKGAFFVHFLFYPTNVVQSQCRGRSNMTLNLIFVLTIVTHAQGFESIKKKGVKCTKQRPSVHTHTHILNLHHKISARKEDKLKIGVDCKIVHKKCSHICGSSKALLKYVCYEEDSFKAVFLNYVSVTSLA